MSGRIHITNPIYPKFGSNVGKTSDQLFLLKILAQYSKKSSSKSHVKNLRTAMHECAQNIQIKVFHRVFCQKTSTRFRQKQIT